MIDSLTTITLDILPATAGRSGAGKSAAASRDAVVEAFQLPPSAQVKPRSDSSSVREKSAAPPPERETGGRSEIERSSAPSPKPTPSARTEDTSSASDSNDPTARTAQAADASGDNQANSVTAGQPQEAAQTDAKAELEAMIAKALEQRSAAATNINDEEAAAQAVAMQAGQNLSAVGPVQIGSTPAQAGQAAPDAASQALAAQGQAGQVAQNLAGPTPQAQNAKAQNSGIFEDQGKQQADASFENPTAEQGPELSNDGQTQSKGQTRFQPNGTLGQSQAKAEMADTRNQEVVTDQTQVKAARTPTSEQAVAAPVATAAKAQPITVKPVEMGAQAVSALTHEGAVSANRAAVATPGAVADPTLTPRATPAEQVAVRLVHQAGEGKDSISFQLHPAELGKIDVRLDVGSDGKVSARIMADNPATLDMLQRDQRQLERALSDAGLKADPGCLDFGLQQNQRQAHQDASHLSQSGRATRALQDVFALVPEASAVSAYNMLGSTQRVDIRI
ncbi:MAG: flagellar hook-length control protein FliK [Alphaproteobacteria bacterium]|nr:MAG: flagellar hook-length control protein FliK [Alphaproteobacteria bacterium]